MDLMYNRLIHCGALTWCIKCDDINSTGASVSVIQHLLLEIIINTRRMCGKIKDLLLLYDTIYFGGTRKWACHMYIFASTCSIAQITLMLPAYRYKPIWISENLISPLYMSQPWTQVDEAASSQNQRIKANWELVLLPVQLKSWRQKNRMLHKR